MMRRSLVVLCLFFAAAAFADEKAPLSGTGKPGSEEIEEIQAEEIIELEPEEIEDFVPAGGFLGLAKYQWLSISGPVIWTLLLLAIGTRLVRPKGKARLMLRLHKSFAYSAFCLGTVHGIFGLFF